MEAVIGVLIGLVVSQGGLLWYKMGKLERGLADLCREVRNNGGSTKEGK